ncbi:DNA gyrase, A subunit [Peptoniphilus duerdenii ATCC BAA-1640]|uniref:DNA gyrase subunit A n=1 Tax=Peptoniphilus duerdenii ATCC BAA-1640 TaxID=862517 RepID=E0NJJ9_9FIRM|nr:DNA gyrase subunit A [Peptoniphilus duerdenii]EFM26019.1 DNA gyrase, A subunit [Peptoniphilus duerdenii ATCC BAA-1640]
MIENVNENGIIDVDISKKMRSSYLDYSMSVIVSRALPDVRDGLKPVHRRIVYGMQTLGITPDKSYRKSATLVGEVMGKFHPHGDSSIYDAAARLAQDFNIRYTLVDGQGNFGNVDGDSPAAPRYTEMRMSKIAQEMLRDINKDTVDFVPNYDEREVEPSVLPSRFPNILVNGSAGIAVGMATNMAPHNLGESISAVIDYINNEDIEIEELMKSIKGPDFPTGAIILGKQGIIDAYKTGRGKIQVRARAEIEEHKGRYKIVITEIPYQVNKTNLIVKIADLVKNKSIEGISNIRDLSSHKTGIKIDIDLKRDANPNVVLNNLYKNTQMQITFGIINLCLVNGEPKVLNLKEIIKYYVDHQRNVVRRRTQFDLEKAEARAHIIEGLKIALDNIDRIIKIVRESSDDQEAKNKFTKEFGLTDIQGQAILDMRIRRLTGLEREKLEQEYQDLIKLIAKLKSILENKKLLDNTIIEELEEIKEKYSDLRRTVLAPDEGDIDSEDLIEEEDVVITLTEFGYIKRMPEGTYKPQRRGGTGISALTTREEDFVKDIYITSTHDTILFFTNFGRVYSLKAYEIPESSRQAKGTAIINLLNLEGDEFVTAVIPVRNVDENANLVMATKNGLIKKTSYSEFEKIRKNGLIAITLNEGDNLIGVRLTSGRDEIMIVTKNGMAIRFSESDVRNMGRTAMGVKSIDLKNDDEVVSFEIPQDDKYLLVISENGFGKMTKMTEYRKQNRAGVGLLTYKATEKSGKLVSAKVIDKSDEIMIITVSGIIIRIGCEGISVMGRHTTGVKLMNIKDSEVVSVAKYIGEEI